MDEDFRKDANRTHTNREPRSSVRCVRRNVPVGQRSTKIPPPTHLLQNQQWNAERESWNQEKDPLHRTHFSEVVNRPLWMDSIMGAPIFEIPEMRLVQEQYEAGIAKASLLQQHKEDEMLQLGIALVELSHADPFLGNILPANHSHNDQVTQQRNEGIESSNKHQIDMERPTTNIEVWSENEFMGTLFGEKQAIIPVNEVMESIPAEITSNVIDGHRSIRIRSESSFKLEEEACFPITKTQYPGIISQIEQYLNCRDKFNFRLAFNNVAIDRDRKVLDIHPAERSQYDGRSSVKMRTCICTTQLFHQTNYLRGVSSQARKLFNEHIRFRPGTGTYVKVQLGYKQAHHQEVVLLKQEPFPMYVTEKTKVAWFYQCEQANIEHVGFTPINHLRRVRCGLKGRKMISRHPKSQKWKEESWIF